MLFSMGGSFMGGEQAKEIPANELVSAIEADRVDELSYTVADGSVRGTYWESDKAKQAKDDPVAFTSTYVGSDSLSELMSAHTRYRVHRRHEQPQLLGATSSSAWCPRFCSSCSCSTSCGR